MLLIEFRVAEFRGISIYAANYTWKIYTKSSLR